MSGGGREGVSESEEEAAALHHRSPSPLSPRLGSLMEVLQVQVSHSSGRCENLPESSEGMRGEQGGRNAVWHADAAGVLLC